MDRLVRMRLGSLHYTEDEELYVLRDVAWRVVLGPSVVQITAPLFNTLSVKKYKNI